MVLATDFIVIFCTCPDQQVADRIAATLVEDRLAACVNIQSNIKSVYAWEGKVETNAELLLFIKTKKPLFEQVAAVIKANHPYTCPEVVALPIEQGGQAYLSWLADNTL